MGRNINTFIPLFLIEDKNHVFTIWDESFLRELDSSSIYINPGSNLTDFWKGEKQAYKLKNQIDKILNETSTKNIIFIPIIDLTLNAISLDSFLSRWKTFQQNLDTWYGNANTNFYIFAIGKISHKQINELLKKIKEIKHGFFLLTDIKKSGSPIKDEDFWDRIKSLLYLIAEIDTRHIPFYDVFPKDGKIKIFSVLKKECDEFIEIKNNLKKSLYDWIHFHLRAPEKISLSSVFFNSDNEECNLENKLKECMIGSMSRVESLLKEVSLIAEIRPSDIIKIKKGVDFLKVYRERILKNLNEVDIDNAISSVIEQFLPELQKRFISYMDEFKTRETSLTIGLINKLKNSPLSGIIEALNNINQDSKEKTNPTLQSLPEISKEVERLFFNVTEEWNRTYKRYLSRMKWKRDLSLIKKIYFPLFLLTILLTWEIIPALVTKLSLSIINAAIISFIITLFVRKKELRKIQGRLLEILKELREDIRKKILSTGETKYEQISNVWIKSYVNRFIQYLDSYRKKILSFLLCIANTFKMFEENMFNDGGSREINLEEEIKKIDWFSELKPKLANADLCLSEMDLGEVIILNTRKLLLKRKPQCAIKITSEDFAIMENELPLVNTAKETNKYIILFNEYVNLDMEEPIKYQAYHSERINGTLLFLFKSLGEKNVR